MFCPAGSQLGASTIGKLAAMVGWLGVGALAPRSLAVETVEFRIVQDTSTAIAQYDAGHTVGNFVVQARVNGGKSLGSFAFDIAIPGEADGNGTLAKLRIQNPDKTYYTGVPTTSGGAGIPVGMASQYFGVAASYAPFGGMINTSSGPFANNPADQEIGLITAIAQGSTLLATPGLDPDGEGNVGTWSGYGSGSVPSNGAVASVNSTIAAAYFCRGAFVDVYRFRYTVSNMASRAMTITVRNVSAQAFQQWRYSGSWMALTTAVPAADVHVWPLTMQVNGTAGRCCSTAGACVVGLAGSCAATDTWMAGATCTPNPCPAAGSCCDPFNCTFQTQASCLASGRPLWHAGTCLPNPCWGVCCAEDGSCAAVNKWDCQVGAWLQYGTCIPNGLNPICPAAGPCCTNGACAVVSPLFCAGLSGTGVCEAGECVSGRCCNLAGCRVTLKVACNEYTFSPGATCASACQLILGACCVGPTCSITTQASCPTNGGTNVWYPWNTACVVDTCWISTSTGTCCTIGGTCTITASGQCGGQWGPGLSCGLPPCAASVGACCSGATCSVIGIAACTSLNMQFAGAGTSCNAVGVSGVPCCYADFNQSGSLAVQDIFDFINRWFAGDATARFGSDGSAGVLSVQNIFDFLNAWFAGCA